LVEISPIQCGTIVPICESSLSPVSGRFLYTG
jgi:hypothetical protein